MVVRSFVVEVALVAALVMIGAACTVRELGGEGTTQGGEDTTDGGTTGTATTGSDAGTTGVAVECPPSATSVIFSSKLVDADGQPVFGNWECVVAAVELTDGALEVDLDCPVESEGGLPTHLSVVAHPPPASHDFVVGETVHVAHHFQTWSELQRVERPDRTLLMLAEWGWSELSDRGVVDYGEVICHTPDPKGRIEYTNIEFDVGEGTFEVPPFAHAEHGSYATWTGRAGHFVPEKSTVTQWFDLDALVLRRAP